MELPVNSNQALLDDIVAALRPLLEPKSCITCNEFDEGNERCMKFNQRPPARVIATGCPKWCCKIPF